MRGQESAGGTPNGVIELYRDVMTAKQVSTIWPRSKVIGLPLIDCGFL
jgi:hypothetical protein